MAKPIQSCLPPEELSRYLAEQLNEAEDSEIMVHLESCTRCQKVIEQIAADQDLWDGMKQHLAGQGSETAELDDPRIRQLEELLTPSEDPAYMGRWGAYEVCGIIGQGSTGIVLKCHEPKLNRYVAIKILSPSLASVGSARRRFEREGRAVAAVSHEHVVPIYAVNEYRGLPFIVMQYIPGVSLLQRIQKKGPLETCEVVRVGLQVAKGLAAAHGQGIIHRDVKPANVILEATVERAMVTDFGLARVADEATMTHSGTIAGTPQYMSPEQARGEPVDVRSDLFSLGSLLYTACTAHPPFRADTVYGIIHRVCETSPKPIAETNPEIAPWLIQFVDRLMAKDREDRFANSSEVAAILENELAYLQNPTAVAVPKRTWLETPSKPKLKKDRAALGQTKNRLAIAIGGLVLLGFLCFAIVKQDWLAKQIGFRSAAPSQPGSSSSQPPAGNSGAFGSAGNSEPNQSISGLLFTQMANVLPDEEPVVTWAKEESESGISSTFRKRTERAFEVGDFDRLVLNAQLGKIELRQTELDYVTLVSLQNIQASSQNEAEKIASYQELRVTRGDNLEIKATVDADYLARMAKRRPSDVTYGIGVPVGMKVTLSTDHGSIRTYPFVGDLEAECQLGQLEVQGLEGNLWARTQGGQLWVRGVQGDVDAMAIFGPLHAKGIAGNGRLRSSDGNIYLGENEGAVSAHATGGDVYLNGVNGEIRAHVEVGDLHIVLPESPTSNCRLSVSGGNVIVAATDEANFSLKARGELQPATDESLDGLPEASAVDEEGWQSMAFNGGGNEIEVSAITGTIQLDVQPQENFEVESLGGSGDRVRMEAYSERGREMTTGEPRAGAMVPIEIENGGNIDGYTLYLPRTYERGTRYPVIIYLQGGYGVGGAITNINDWGLPRLIRNVQGEESSRNALLLERFIVVSPHIENGNYYDHPEVVERILDSVDQEFGIDRTRIYATGLSSGGHGTWGLAERLPNTFAAIAPVAGRDRVENYGALTNVPIWVAHNRQDPSIDWEESDGIVKRIERISDHSFTRYDSPLPTSNEYLEEDRIFTQANNDRHDAWTDVYTSEQFYLWLLEHSRSEI